MLALKVLAFILTAISVPFALMFSHGHFVGVRAAPWWVRNAVIFAIFLLMAGPIWSLCFAKLREGGALNFMYAALVLGAGISGLIGIQELNQRKQITGSSDDVDSP